MKRILFVDDSLTLREIATQVFSRSPYELVLAGNDEEALRAYEVGPFDLIVLDAGMIEGAFSRQVGVMGLNSAGSSRIDKVLLLCSLFHPYDVSPDRLTSVCAVFKKPFEVAPFLELVQKLLSLEVPIDIRELHPPKVVSSQTWVEPQHVGVHPPTIGVGIPEETPMMPRLPFLARAPLPGPVFAALMELAQKGKAYEAIAQLSAETIAQIAWEVVPMMARTMMMRENSTEKE